MKKIEKKLDKELVRVLTAACETAKVMFPGFQWLTHFADYRSFPESLQVLCVFDSHTNLRGTDKDAFYQHIQTHLKDMGLYIRHMQKQVLFDTEEDCEIEQGGDWQHRFRLRY